MEAVSNKGFLCYPQTYLQTEIIRSGSDEWSTSSLAIPALRPPSDSMVGILNVPLLASLHRPFAATLHIQNRSPSRTADLVLQVESSEAFVVAGPKAIRLPTLLPSTSVQVRFNLVPLQCGMGRLPTFKVFDRRQRTPTQPEAVGEATITLDVVPIIDEQSEARDEAGVDLLLHVPSTEDPRQLDVRKGGITLLVLP